MDSSNLIPDRFQRAAANSASAFAERFTPNGDGYIFQPNLRAPAVQVTAAERDRFIAGYRRDFVIGVCAVFGVIAVIAMLFAHATSDENVEIPIWTIYAAILPPALGFIVWCLWFDGAAGRITKDRPAIRAALPREEATRLIYQRMPWRRLMFGAISVVVLGLPLAYDLTLPLIWRRLWLVVPTSLLALTAYRAIRKLMAGHSHTPPQTP